MDTTLAKRYAQALLDLGIEDGQYLKYGEELKDFSSALAETGEDSKVLSSPLYSEELRTKILSSILDKASLSPIVNNFIKLLFDRGRFTLLSSISDSYLKFVDQKEGIVRGILYSPSTLNQRDFSAIREALSIYTGQKVELTQEEDPSLIGGVVARLGDLVLDGSVKTRLSKLAATFTED